MFLKTQLTWNVLIPAENLDAEGLVLQKAILVRLLDDFATKKTSKDIGYLLAITTLDHIGEGIVRQHSGDLLFPVEFSCITFKMFPGEVLEGVVHRILKHGVFLRCGPQEIVYLSHLKMADFQYVPGENPFFRNEKSSKIEKGTVVRFEVLAEKYVEAEREFQAVVSLEDSQSIKVAKNLKNLHGKSP
ncbi:DNA-directed RNA polymerase subunit E' [Handroanthus impetiginosus]|uniref:DNA-directed RNA polymerase subunit n=1 Tax=Handroanthus impetiginosus TaxID=429701 RepID=A0A2G9G9L5_9LAMI|nr:DNA-directed RNA polymerase subunit E' [Handroanthus impetiginosus]PIN08844.1 DNA-directed RNA polymerase subunit E' [Handroanthus impetiginosus]